MLSAWRCTMLRWLLRACGLVDCLAICVVFLSSDTITSLHSLTGQKPFPHETIAFYLTRSASLMYAAHGILLMYLSFDVERWLQVIRVLAVISILHGLLIIYVDITTNMPLWWTLVEGPLLISWGILVLFLAGRQKA